jgi:phosphoribosylanthranilate isomerase
MNEPQESVRVPQVKICGLKDPRQAEACARLGAKAIGCVFFAKSPRCVSEAQAREIREALHPSVYTVGVLVNEPFSEIMRKVEACGLSAVQLHGRETPELVERLGREGVRVIKGLYVNAEPSLESAPSYKAFAYLAECSGGPLPGGNALGWNWGAARDFGERYPLVLAGGLSPDNVAEAVGAASPDAVDVSSGVEAEPGRKDLDKVRRFMEAVSRAHCGRGLRRIFSCSESR